MRINAQPYSFLVNHNPGSWVAKNKRRNSPKAHAEVGGGIGLRTRTGIGLGILSVTRGYLLMPGVWGMGGEVVSLLVPFRVEQGAEKDAAALLSPKGLLPCPRHVWGRAGSVL